MDSFPRDYHSSVNNDDVTILKPNGSFIGVGTEQNVDEDIVFECVNDNSPAPQNKVPNVNQSDNVLQDEAFVDFEDTLQSGETSIHAIKLDFEGQIVYKASVLRLISTGVGLRNQHRHLLQTTSYNHLLRLQLLIPRERIHKQKQARNPPLDGGLRSQKGLRPFNPLQTIGLRNEL